MPLLAVKQTSNSVGTSTMVLNPVTGPTRSFFQALGGPRRVRVAIRQASAFEYVYGQYDGGNPGAITRAAVIYSSNNNALVNFGTGSKEVFLVPDVLEPEIVAFGVNTAANLTNLGNVYAFNGAASATFTPPAASVVPIGAGYKLVNNGSAWLVVDPLGAETVNGYANFILPPGDQAEIVCTGTGWIALGLRRGDVWLSKATVSAAVGWLDIGLPLGFNRFRLDIDDLITASATSLALRTSINGGATVPASGTDYHNIIVANGSPTSGTGAQILLTGNGGAGGLSFGTLEISPGSASSPARVIGAVGIQDGSGGVALAQTHGQRTANARINLVRLFGLAGNLTGGSVTLLGRRE